MIFGFLFVGNSIGMIPFSTTITSNLTNTFFIAATVFVVVLTTMIVEKGITHLIGLFLPCNVLLQETTDKKIKVSIIDPETFIDIVNDPRVGSVILEVKKRLSNVIKVMDAVE